MKKLEKYDLKAYDVRDKIVLINDANNDISEEAMGVLSIQLKKAGAIEVIYAYGGVTLQSFSKEDLKQVGLVQIEKKKAKGKKKELH